MIKKVENKTTDFVYRSDSILKLIPRLIVGLIFVPAGWGKLNNLSQTIEYFTSLGIPAAQLQAPFVAGVELIFGLTVLIGLFTRISTLPLIGTMVVALATAHRAEFQTVFSVIEILPAMYLTILLCVLALGSGTLSADHYRK